MRIPSDRYDGPPPYDVDGNQARLLQMWEENPFHDEEAGNEHNNQLVISVLALKDFVPSLQFIGAVEQMLYGLYVYEGLYDLPGPIPYEWDHKEKEVLYATHAFRLEEADRFVCDFFQRFFRHIKPEIAFADPTGRTVPLIEFCNNPAQVVNDFYQFAYCEAFPKIQKVLFDILALASGLNPSRLTDNPKYKWPRDADGAPTQLVETYLRNTPFERVLTLALPFNVSGRIRAEHTHVVAGSGAGKTTLLTGQFLEDVFDDRQPALIVIDGKGAWAPTLQRFACFAPERKQSERLIILNPQDATAPAALNMFDVPDRSLVDSVSENLAYIFGSREFELSPKQRTAFSYAAQLIFSMPGKPTIETLLALMQDPAERTGGVPASSPFRYAIDRQPNINKRFLNELFYHPTEFLETKRQIQNRIYDLLSCSAFASMFTQPDNRLNMGSVMNEGKILIVDASPGAVGEKAASTFGRYIISMALATARARINIPQSWWRPTYLYIDEAQLFVDEERTQPLLQQAREFNLGVILAHQKLADLTPTLRATFAGNTSSKYCAGASADDARDMAKEMRCDADFILGQGHRDGHAHFAAYVRGLTPRAVSYQFKLGTMSDTSKMTNAQYAELIARNRALLSPVRSNEPPPVPIEASSAAPDEAQLTEPEESPETPAPAPKKRKQW